MTDIKARESKWQEQDDGERTAADTLSEQAASLVEQDILAGRWKPEMRLGIHALSAHYGIGATPLREGLSRLVSKGLISVVGQRGFRVASVSRADLEDITNLRKLIEAEALRLSMQKGDDAWEAGILAALHRLRRNVENNPEQMQDGNPEFDTLHKAFHRSLIAACGSERMLALHDSLYLQAYRYRRAMMGAIREKSWFLWEHQELADLAIARDEETVVARLSAHLHHTLDVVYDSGQANTVK
ncbi:FCD domain-containing protein (plasmid) [Rhizobium lusitanum]|uniref:GntR family transcriptional regulator n=1 Tax=Rhizobium lusitanum TaxID=293958 RepID=UPI0016098D92|nr:FCD domain-containing protein [Rhizobium lusitanum]QND46001.1 FCD domain-containing protein [Rhizobium lusitanum]